MTSPESYLQRAVEAERLARQAATAEERLTYVAIARAWRDLAAKLPPEPDPAG